jgi:phenylalanyl-tRNA synthetase alpha chain
MLDRIAELRQQGEAAVAGAPDTAALEDVRVRFLGRKAELPNLLRGVAALPAEERGEVGRAANEARRALDGAIEARRAQLEAGELERRLAEDVVDVTLPGSPAVPVGRHHLITATRREIEDVFIGLGFRVVEGPETELVYYNFDALNHAPQHPARLESDTFYLADDIVLRTHTSPMQVRSMESQPPPIFVVVPGRCYRSDPFDATHSPIFHQVEGLAVGEDITLADLKGTLDQLARGIFGPDRETRFRPGYFPFTEPSVEVDVSCFRCGGTGRLPDGSRDPLCKGIGWIEILGAGMVDPNVYGFVRENGYDPEKVQGFAFGMGVERIAMLKYGVPDLRKFFENDVRVLEQFR